MAIPGLLAIHDTAVSGISDLPSAYDLSVPSPLSGLLANPLLERVYAVVATPWDKGAGAVATWPLGGASGVHLASGEYQTTPSDTPPNQLFSARLQNPYNLTVNIFSSGQLAAHSLPGYGAVTVLFPDGALDAFTSWSWAGCQISVYLGQKGAPWSQFTQIFAGTAAGVTWTTEALTIQLRDLQHLFSVPVQKQLYTAPCPQVVTVGDKVVVAGFPAQTGSLTVEAWVYVADLSTAMQVVAAMDDNTNGFALRLNDGGAGSVRFITRALSAPALTTAAGALVLGWNHVAAVYDHAGQTKVVYVGGVSQATAASLTGALAAPTTPLTLFANPGFFGVAASVGTRVSELRIWSTARTQAQVQANMRLRYLGTEAGLAGYWPGWAAGDGQGAVLHDQTAAANHGTLTGCTWGQGDWVDPSIAGKPIPLCYGVVRQAAAVLVDANTPGGPTYQGHDRGMQSFDTVYDKGAPLTAGVNYLVDLARGYILFQANYAPAGQITFDAHGDNVGGFVSSAADVARRIAVRHAGLTDPAQVSVASVAAANAANSAAVGWASAVPVNVDATLDLVMGSPYGWWVMNRLGLFSVGVVAATGAPALYLTEKQVIIDQKPLARLATPEPAWREVLGYHRIWTVQQPGNLATGLPLPTVALYGQDYSHVTGKGSLLGPPQGYPLAVDRASDVSLFDASADAQAEADRRFALLSVKRDLYQVALASSVLFQYDVGTVVSPTLTLQNQSGPVVRLLAGQSYLCVGFIENVMPGGGGQPDEVALFLWGPF
jgi:hypothetical protein